MRGFEFSKSKIHPGNTEIHFMDFAIPSGSRSWWGFRFPHTLDLDIFRCRLASTKCGRITEQSQKGQLTCFSGSTSWKKHNWREGRSMPRKKKSEKNCHKNIVCMKVTDIELEILNQHATTAGLSRSEYLRKLFLEEEIHVHYEVVADMKILCFESVKFSVSMGKILLW